MGNASSSHTAPTPDREAAAPERPSGGAPAVSRWRRAWPWLVDVLAVATVLAVAVPIRWAYTQGDLWYDEADYAFAASRGVQANRLDRSDVPTEPERLLRFRHYHPPLVAYAGLLALRYGSDARTLRVPAVIVGGATAMLLYLCGLALFGSAAASGLRRDDPAMGPDPRLPAWLLVRVVAFACAFIAALTPANVRAGSHLLPWPFLIFWMVLLAWTLMQYARTRRPLWIPAASASLAGLFVTSEYFFPILLACGLALPALVWPFARTEAERRRIAVALVVGVCLFLTVALVLWPAGLTGGALKMLGHYVAMASDRWPMVLRGHAYERAPKWAYLYWYWRDYRLYLGLYSLGVAGLLVAAAWRKLPAAGWVLGAFTAVLLLSAHRSHIIGPEYLAHVLPFLTLTFGLFLILLARRSRWLAVGLAVLACLGVIRRHDPGNLSGMDPQAQVSRWPQAARAVASRWRPDDRALAQQYGVVGRWYVLHAPGVRAQEWQVQALPSEDTPKVLSDVVSGVYRFAALGSTVTEQPPVGPRLSKVISRWPVIWRSAEAAGRPSRLIVYQLPRGVTHRHPLPIPP